MRGVAEQERAALAETDRRRDGARGRSRTSSRARRRCASTRSRAGSRRSRRGFVRDVRRPRAPCRSAARARLAFNGKTTRKSVVSSATCSSPFIAGSARVDIGDVEQMGVRAARKSDRQRLAHGGMRAVAAGDVGGLARLGRAIRLVSVARARRPAPPRTPRSSVCARPRRRASARRSISSRSCSSCGIDQRIGERTEAVAHVAEDHARDVSGRSPRD